MSEYDQGILNEMFKDRPTKTSQPKDEILMIVDRSGSMSSIRDDAEGGVNTFISEQKTIEGAGANITLVEFDTVYDILCEGVDIQEAPSYKLTPRGGTALLDAIGQGVNSLSPADGTNVIVVVVTDGGENSSREFTHEAVTNLIKEKEEAGWEFLFLAANQDAIQAGATMGFAANKSVNFAGTSDGVKFAYDVASTYTTSLRTKNKADALLDLEEVVKKGEQTDTE